MTEARRPVLPPTPDTPLRLGTRASPLAQAQARMAAAALVTAHGWNPAAVVLVPMTASGDRIQDRALAEVGGKALWTRELDHALADGEIDAAVHSLKDVETIRPAQFVIAAMLERADPRDRLIGAASIAGLPHGARVGTASPRRAAQLLNIRPDLDIGLIRGNVATRLAKIDAGEADATLLAAAGLDRLDLHDIGTTIPIETMLPAPSQGAIGIETLAEYEAVRSALAAIDHKATRLCVGAERALLAALGADCQSPVGGHAMVESDGTLTLRAQLLSNDGTEEISGRITVAGDATPEIMASKLLGRASPKVRALFSGTGT